MKKCNFFKTLSSAVLVTLTVGNFSNVWMMEEEKKQKAIDCITEKIKENIINDFPNSFYNVRDAVSFSECLSRGIIEKLMSECGDLNEIINITKDGNNYVCKPNQDKIKLIIVSALEKCRSVDISIKKTSLADHIFTDVGLGKNSSEPKSGSIASRFNTLTCTIKELIDKIKGKGNEDNIAFAGGLAVEIIYSIDLFINEELMLFIKCATLYCLDKDSDLKDNELKLDIVSLVKDYISRGGPRGYNFKSFNDKKLDDLFNEMKKQKVQDCSEGEYNRHTDRLGYVLK